MKTLVLVRHAKSSWKDLKLNDFDRPLNNSGKIDGASMAKLLRKSGEKPGLIISSPAKRALSTAYLMAKELDIPVSDIEQNEAIYEASSQRLLEIIYNLDDRYDSIMLIGHNPGMTILSDQLTGHHIDNIPTCGVVKMTFEIQRWKEVIKGSGSMESFRYPKQQQAP